VTQYGVPDCPAATESGAASSEAIFSGTLYAKREPQKPAEEDDQLLIRLIVNKTGSIRNDPQNWMPGLKELNAKPLQVARLIKI
jgi:hypothetical protein